MWAYAGTYRLVTENQIDEENVWYINDEVGSAIRHSDAPNFALHPFIYAPNNKFDDPHTITFSITWPIADVDEGEAIFRDFLKGFDETKFRSSRFTVWFNTPQQYFSEQLSIYNGVKPIEDAMAVHSAYQDKYAPLGSIDDHGSLPIKVYSDYGQLIGNLTD